MLTNTTAKEVQATCLHLHWPLIDITSPPNLRSKLKMQTSQTFLTYHNNIRPPDKKLQQKNTSKTRDSRWQNTQASCFFELL